MATPVDKKVKTYKREVASGLLLFFVYVVVIMRDIEMVKVIIYPIFGFAIGAFGLDAILKQKPETE